MYEGAIIGDNDTPAMFGAQSGSNLMCYVKIHPRESATSMGYNNMKNSTFGSRFPYAKKKSSVPSFPSKSAPVVAPRPETDREYAKRIIDSGIYTSALREVHANRVLRSLFMDKLNQRDAKLYRVRLLRSFDTRFSTAILMYWMITSLKLLLFLRVLGSIYSVVVICRERRAIVLLTDQDHSNLLTICDMMNVDHETATLQYLECNKDMENYVQRYL